MDLHCLNWTECTVSYVNLLGTEWLGICAPMFCICSCRWGHVQPKEEGFLPHSQGTSTHYFAYLHQGLCAHFPSELALSPLLFNRWLAHLFYEAPSSLLSSFLKQRPWLWLSLDLVNHVIQGLFMDLSPYETMNLGRENHRMCHVWPVFLSIRTVST